MPIPDYNKYLNTNYGLATGLAEGLKSGLMAYKDEKHRQREETKDDEASSLKKKSFDLDVMKSGYEETPEGRFQISPIAQEREQAKAMRDEKMKRMDAKLQEDRELLAKRGLIAERDSDGNVQNLKPVSGYTDPDLEKERLHQGFLSGENSKNRESAEKIAGMHSRTAQMNHKDQNRLSQATVIKANEGNQLPSVLQKLKETVTQNSDTFGPVAGRVAAGNPYNERGQTIEAQIGAAAQKIGKFLEGGVLRAEDVPKYRAMLPNLRDVPSVAQNKIALVEQLLIDAQNSELSALKGSGYDTAGVDRGLVSPATPNILSGKRGLMPEAQASSMPASSSPKPGMVQDGYQFVGGNPADPKSWKRL